MPEQNDRSMQDLKPTVWIGKQGCSETMIEEIVAQLKKRRLIKVKWLQNTEVDPEAVAAQAKARLVEVRGRTMVLADKGKAAGTPATAAKVPAKPTAKAVARASVAPKPRERPSLRAPRTAEKAPARPASRAKTAAPKKSPGRSTARSPARSSANTMGKGTRSAKSRQTGTMKAKRK